MRQVEKIKIPRLPIAGGLYPNCVVEFPALFDVMGIADEDEPESFSVFLFAHTKERRSVRISMIHQYNSTPVIELLDRAVDVDATRTLGTIRSDNPPRDVCYYHFFWTPIFNESESFMKRSFLKATSGPLRVLDDPGPTFTPGMKETNDLLKTLIDGVRDIHSAIKFKDLDKRSVDETEEMNRLLRKQGETIKAIQEELKRKRPPEPTISASPPTGMVLKCACPVCGWTFPFGKSTVDIHISRVDVTCPQCKAVVSLNV